jgi:hypothetical protein
VVRLERTGRPACLDFLGLRVEICDVIACWVVLLARYQRPQAIRQRRFSRLSRVLAYAGVRNAATIAAGTDFAAIRWPR